VTSNRGCTPVEGYVRFLSRFFFASGHDADDLAQEARIAAWLCPEHPRLAARRRVLDVINAAQRKPQFAEFVDAPNTVDITDLIEARERLRAILSTPLTTKEREAVRRLLAGESTSEPKWVDNALYAARRKLKAA